MAKAYTTMKDAEASGRATRCRCSRDTLKAVLAGASYTPVPVRHSVADAISVVSSVADSVLMRPAPSRSSTLV
jgi:hypothetical protein